MRGLSAKRISRNQLLAVQARDNLPVGQYLSMIHDAILTGLLPIFEIDPRTGVATPTGKSQELRVDQRLDLAKDMLNRALPALPKEITVTTEADADAHSALEVKAIEALSTEELKQVVDASFEVLRARPAANE